MKQHVIVLLKRSGWALLGLFGVFLALLLAWAASNCRWADAAPQPRPAQLQINPATVAPERNAFFALSGIYAPAGLDFVAWGRERAVQGDTEPSKPQPRLNGAPLICDAAVGHCVASWLAAPFALREQMLRHAEIGQRCEALMTNFGFEELRPAKAFASPYAPTWTHTTGAFDCARWLQAQAVLGASHADLGATLHSLEQADRLGRGLLSGSHSLISHAVAWGLLRRQWQAVAELGARYPEWAARLQPLLRPREPAALSAERWIAHESSASYALISQLETECQKPRSPAQSNWADSLFCRLGIGVLIQESLQASDRYWLSMLDASRRDITQALARVPLKPEDSPNWYSALVWRNSVGHMLQTVFEQFSQQTNYLAKQADVELHRRAAAMALQMAAERVPAAGRSDWLAAQPLPSGTKRFSIEGDTLRASPWLAEVQPKIEPREQIQIPLARL